MKSYGRLLTFYRSFAMPNVLLTAVCLFSMMLRGKEAIALFPGFFWLKVFMLGISFYYVHTFRKKEYFYYHNLGWSKSRLWWMALGFDFGLFLIASLSLSIIFRNV
ncbi:MAG: hypothetical protein IAE84_01780 [Saprospiraceae bacterium]|nr:hypothetical protein [Saprospiraceae bacterium]HRF42153.1 hypothetical protein [Saprospiraceae bacterium]HRK82131.1 hypothetical protein [Saprospiraceae bacterium]